MLFFKKQIVDMFLKALTVPCTVLLRTSTGECRNWGIYSRMHQSPLHHPGGRQHQQCKSRKFACSKFREYP